MTSMSAQQDGGLAEFPDATWWGLEHFIGGATLEDLAGQDLARREGREYRLG
jgi:hypothetical protein